MTTAPPSTIEHAWGTQRWQVDTPAAGQVMAWVRRNPAAWAVDLREMKASFPRWVLVGSQDQQPSLCAACGNLVAPQRDGLCCVACGRPGAATHLAWLGQLPVLARPEAEFAPRRAALHAAGFGEVVVGGLAYLLVPLVLVYPTEWPLQEPAVTYAPAWLQALGLASAGSFYHLYWGGRACLFATGQWRPMPVAAVLQQRVVNHVGSLLKIAAGMEPGVAFIGRVEHAAWQPTTQLTTERTTATGTST